MIRLQQYWHSAKTPLFWMAIGGGVCAVLGAGMWAWPHARDHGEFHRVIAWVNGADAVLLRLQQRVEALEKRP